MPPPPKRSFTKNPARPARYRAGKAIPEAPSSDEEDEDEEEPDNASTQAAQRAPAPKATSYKPKPSSPKRETEEERRQRLKDEHAERERMEREAGFVTESESEEDEDGVESPDKDETVSRSAPKPTMQAEESDDSEVDSSSEEESSSSSEEEDGRRRLVRPVFIRKDQRQLKPNADEEAERLAAEEALRKQEQTDSLIQETIVQRQAQRRTADEEEAGGQDAEEIDTNDELDTEGEELAQQQWVARELERLKRARTALEEQEREIAEKERRQALTEDERRAEDAAHIAKQQDERKARGPVQHMQKYHHKGAFYVDDAEQLGLRARDLMGASYADQDSAKDVLPEYLQVRDVTKIGRKGRTRYKDLKSEDTGRFGLDLGRGRMGSGRGGGFGDVADDRFKPDNFSGSRGADGPTGANASAVGVKRRPIGETVTRERSRSPKRARTEEAVR